MSSRYLLGSSAQELRPLVRLSIPLTGIYITELIKFVADMIIVGRLGASEFAAVSLSADLLYCVLMLPLGVLAMVPVAVSSAFGSGHPGRVRESVHTGLLMALVLSVPTTILGLLIPAVLSWTEQPPNVVHFSTEFLTPAVWSVAPILVFTALRGAGTALGRPYAFLSLLLGGALVNIPVCYLLVFGGFGISPLGVEGAGLATALVNVGLMLSAIALVVRSPSIGSHFIGRFCTDSWKQGLLGLARSGGPVAAASVFEYGAFMVMAVLMGSFGLEALTASQIVSNVLWTTSLLAYGIGDAGTIRVALHLGKEHAGYARSAGMTAICLMTFCSLAVSAAFWLMPERLTSIFIDADASNAAIFQLASSFFLAAGAFQIGNSVQVVIIRLLRGYSHTLIALQIAAVCYWVIGLGLGLCLAYWADWQGLGLWAAFGGGICLGSVVAFRRFNAISEQQLSARMAGERCAP